MKVLIACAGDGVRWDNHLGIRKHQAPIDGVPILERQIGQFQAAGIRPLVLCHPDHAYDYDGADYTTVPRDPVSSIDKVLSSRHLWSDIDWTLITFGDVYFSDQGFAKLLERKAKWAVYGRLGKSPYNRKLHGLFAIGFPPGEAPWVAATCRQLRALDHAGQIGPGGRLIAWYQHVTGQPLNRDRLKDRGHWVQIRDETDDADKPVHYRMLQRSVEKAARR